MLCTSTVMLSTATGQWATSSLSLSDSAAPFTEVCKPVL